MQHLDRHVSRIAAALVITFAWTSVCPAAFADQPATPLQQPHDPDPAVSVDQAITLHQQEINALNDMARRASALAAGQTEAAPPTGQVAVSQGATPRGVLLTFTAPERVEAVGSWGDGVWGTEPVTIDKVRAIAVDVPPWEAGPQQFFVKYRYPGASNPWSEPIASDVFQYGAPPTPPPVEQPKAVSTTTTTTTPAGHPVDTMTTTDPQGQPLAQETFEWDSTHTQVVGRTVTTDGVDTDGHPQTTTLTFGDQDRLVRQVVTTTAPATGQPVTRETTPFNAAGQATTPTTEWWVNGMWQAQPPITQTTSTTTNAAGHPVDTTVGTGLDGQVVSQETLEWTADRSQVVERSQTFVTADADGQPQATTTVFGDRDQIVSQTTTPVQPPPVVQPPPPPVVVAPPPPVEPPAIAEPPPVAVPALAVTETATAHPGDFDFVYLTVTTNQPITKLTVQYQQPGKGDTLRPAAQTFDTPVTTTTVRLEHLAFGATYEYIVHVVDAQGRTADSGSQSFAMPKRPPVTPPAPNLPAETLVAAAPPLASELPVEGAPLHAASVGDPVMTDEVIPPPSAALPPAVPEAPPAVSLVPEASAQANTPAEALSSAQTQPLVKIRRLSVGAQLEIQEPKGALAYDVYAANDVLGPWELMASNLPAESSGLTVWQDQQYATQRFYRVEVSPTPGPHREYTRTIIFGGYKTTIVATFDLQGSKIQEEETILDGQGRKVSESFRPYDDKGRIAQQMMKWYDPATGQMTSRTETAVTYMADGGREHRSVITDAQGRKTGDSAWIFDADGRNTQYELTVYNPVTGNIIDHTVTSTTYMADGSWEQRYLSLDSQGRNLSESMWSYDPQSHPKRKIEIYYDPATGRPTSRTETTITDAADGGREEFAVITDAQDRKTRQVVTTFNQWDRRVQVTETTYDLATGQPIQMEEITYNQATDRIAQRIATTYDLATGHRIRQVTRSEDSNFNAVEITVTYDLVTEQPKTRTTITTAFTNGAMTTLEELWDPNASLWRRWKKTAGSTVMVYDLTTGKLAQSTTTVYDRFPREVASETVVTYDALEQELQRVEKQFGFLRNGTRREEIQRVTVVHIPTQDGLWQTTITTADYDFGGNPRQVVQRFYPRKDPLTIGASRSVTPEEEVTTTYDAPTGVAQGEERSTFDTQGRSVQHRQTTFNPPPNEPAVVETEFAYDPTTGRKAREVTTRWDSPHRLRVVSEQRYDSAGNQTLYAITDYDERERPANRKSTEWTYENLWWLSKRVDAQFVADSGGQWIPTTQTETVFHTTSWVETITTFDSQGRKSRVDETTYGAQGLPTQIVATAYDSQGRAINKRITTVVTDAKGRRIETTITYDQDQVTGRTETIVTRDPLDNQAEETTERDGQGRLLKRTVVITSWARTVSSVYTIHYDPTSGWPMDEVTTIFDSQGRKAREIAIAYGKGIPITRVTTVFNTQGKQTGQAEEYWVNGRWQSASPSQPNLPAETLVAEDPQVHAASVGDPVVMDDPAPAPALAVTETSAVLDETRPAASLTVTANQPIVKLTVQYLQPGQGDTLRTVPQTFDTPVTTATVTLDALTPGATYQYIVRVEDAQGQTVDSDVRSFAGPPPPPVVAPPLVTPPPAGPGAPSGMVQVATNPNGPGVLLTFTVPGVVEAIGSWGDAVWGTEPLTIDRTATIVVDTPPWTPGAHAFLVQYRYPGAEHPWSGPIASNTFAYGAPAPPPAAPTVITTTTTTTTPAGHPVDTMTTTDPQGQRLAQEIFEWDPTHTQVTGRTMTTDGVDTDGHPQTTTWVFDAQDRLVRQVVTTTAPATGQPVTRETTPFNTAGQATAPIMEWWVNGSWQAQPPITQTTTTSVNAAGHLVDTTVGTDPQGQVFSKTTMEWTPDRTQVVGWSLTTIAPDAAGQPQATTTVFGDRDQIVSQTTTPVQPPPIVQPPPPPVVSPPPVVVTPPPVITAPPVVEAPPLGVTDTTVEPVGGFGFARLTVTASRPFVKVIVQHSQAGKPETSRTVEQPLAAPASTATVRLESLTSGEVYEYIVRLVDAQGRVVDAAPQTFFLPGLPHDDTVVNHFNDQGQLAMQEVTTAQSTIRADGTCVTDRAVVDVVYDGTGRVTAVEAQPVTVTVGGQTASGTGYAAIQQHPDGSTTAVQGVVSPVFSAATKQWQVETVEATATVSNPNNSPGGLFPALADVKATQTVTYTPKGTLDTATVTSYEIDSPSAKLIQQPDGALEFYFPVDPAPYVTRRPDGTFQFAEGTGVTRQTLADGTVEVRHPSGITWHIAEDGKSVTVTRPTDEPLALRWRGSAIDVIAPDGNRATVRPDELFGATTFLIEEIERLQAGR